MSIRVLDIGRGRPRLRRLGAWSGRSLRVFICLAMEGTGVAGAFAVHIVEFAAHAAGRKIDAEVLAREAGRGQQSEKGVALATARSVGVAYDLQSVARGSNGQAALAAFQRATVAGDAHEDSDAHAGATCTLKSAESSEYGLGAPPSLGQQRSLAVDLTADVAPGTEQHSGCQEVMLGPVHLHLRVPHGHQGQRQRIGFAGSEADALDRVRRGA